MVDIAQQIAHWREGAREEWQVAGELLEKERIRHVVDAGVVKAVRHYLDVLRREHGLQVDRAVVFGSYVKGRADEWSDIDLVVVAPDYDGTFSRDDVSLLWRVAAHTDSRIEPIPCGIRQWDEDQSSAIIEIARREGQVILPDAA